MSLLTIPVCSTVSPVEHKFYAFETAARGDDGVKGMGGAWSAIALSHLLAFMTRRLHITRRKRHYSRLLMLYRDAQAAYLIKNMHVTPDDKIKFKDTCSTTSPLPYLANAACITDAHSARLADIAYR